MPIDIDKMNAERAKRNAGGELWECPEGDTRIYVCAFPRPNDDVPYIETRMHYGLGPKGKSSHMCLEPSINKALLNEDFQEQLAFLKKVLGPCETCERRDRGESVSGDPEQDGKPQSRWLWLVLPHSTRTSANLKFKELAPEVKGLYCGYRVWNGLMDQFGQCGDITNMDAAILPRILREGTKFSTKWEVQADLETARKPIKLSADLRELITESTLPGAEYDPLRILAVLAKEPADIAKIYAEDNKPDEYEQPADAPAEGAKGFKPPPGKGKSQAQVPAGKPTAPAATKPAAPAKPAAAPAKPAQKAASPAAGATKAAAPKAESKPAAAGKGGNDALVKLIIKQVGKQPPGCLNVDPDPEAPICVGDAETEACPFREPCFKQCGVKLPDPPVEEVAEEAAVEEAVEEVAEELAETGMTVEQAVAGEPYWIVDLGVVATFKGPAKGQFYFTGADGKAVKVPPGSAIEAPPDEEAPAEEAAAEEPAVEEAVEETEDEAAKLAELEAQLAARKGKKGAPAKK